MDDIETTTCNLCGCPSASYRYTLADYALQRPEVESALVQCSQCGLVYQNPRPGLAAMAAHYPADYASYQIGGQRRADRLAAWAYEYGLWKRSRFVTRRKRGGKLLDVGCATGEFLEHMRRQGAWQVYGVEINPEVAATARRRHGLEVFAGALEAARYADAQFDVVTLGDVLEHAHDPAALLREIARILKPGGVVVIRVPNLNGWSARLAGRYWAGLDAPRHLYVFTPQTLGRLLARNGLCVLEQNSATGDYALFVLTVQFWLNGRSAAPQTTPRLLGLLNHPLTRLAAAPVFALLARLLQGSVLVTTAAKTVDVPAQDVRTEEAPRVDKRLEAAKPS
jgi:SAM-dependent methyltransferase